jgi:hypothetical protein
MAFDGHVDVRSFRTTPEGHFTSRLGLPEYADWRDESMSWKDACYIGDWSFLWERGFRGPDALRQPRRLLRTLVSNPDVVDVSRSLFQTGPAYDYVEIQRDQRGFAYTDTVIVDGMSFGILTSRGHNRYFRQMLALVLHVAHCGIGTEVTVVWATQAPAEGDPRNGGTGAVQERQPTCRFGAL